ncbi:choice-of-anchor Q domain-containing protein [Motilibacter deserti]|uniref:PKD domain-containing protein n=1 Tax=Motilibacter deserti TaxID=2714956 RepID=A0ABX0GTV0_9ACTN|nr:choice-of-anchor Q domain-containing protein [Motilibacter deserti]NHC13097.1 hypothetical protein [Motilibacter deserti]
MSARCAVSRPPTRSGRRLLALAAAVPLVLVVDAATLPPPAGAAAYTVNSLGDGGDAVPGNGVCETGPGNGVCTLRAALDEANAGAGADVVTVPAGTIAVGDVLEIDASVEVVGAGATTVLDGGGSAGVLRISAGAVTVRGLVVEDGDDSSAGGGVRVGGGTVELRDIVLRDNSGFTGGGGLYVGPAATVTVRRASIVDNHATGAFGGGLWNQGSAWVYDTLIAGNDSNRAGGVRNDGDLNLRNVTVSGNTVHSPDAGVGGISQNGFAFLNNVTVTLNTGSGNIAGSFRGGGIQTSSGRTTVMKNSIVSGNNGAGGPADCDGAFTADSRYNLLGDTTGCTLPASTATWKLGANPQLGPLANNGGPTRTHLPAAASPVVNAGAPVTPGGPAADACEAADQRGIPRLICDMGAVEREVAVPGTLTVNTTADAVDTLPGNGTCATGGGLCSLRAAVQESNGLPGRQTIEVPTGTYNLTIPSAGEGGIDPAAAGDLDLTDDVTILGADRAGTIVDANDHSRVFEVAPLQDADISHLTVRDGTDSSGGGISVVTADLTLDDVAVADNVSTGAGGGIGTSGIDEVLTITGSIVRDNTASFGDGGGIDASGTVQISDSLVHDNTASFAGGGMRLTGSSVVRRVTVRDNTTLAGPLSNGGGISASGATIEDSTVSGNDSGGHGGGVFGSGTTLRNSTVSGNTAATSGGGVSTSGTLTLVHATVTANTAVDNGEGAFAFGSSASISLRNTILYDPGDDAECSGVVPASAGGNIARDGSCGLTGAADQPATNPQLNALLDNGGPTRTHLPSVGSPAVDAASSAGVAADQRGVARPQGASFDIGAVEGSGAPALPLSVAGQTVPVGPNRPFAAAVAVVSAPGVPVSALSALIAWGDGTTSPGAVAGPAGAPAVFGSHAYAAPGSYMVTVTVTGPTGSVMTTSTVTVT